MVFVFGRVMAEVWALATCKSLPKNAAKKGPAAKPQWFSRVANHVYTCLYMFIYVYIIYYDYYVPLSLDHTGYKMIHVASVKVWSLAECNWMPSGCSTYPRLIQISEIVTSDQRGRLSRMVQADEFDEVLQYFEMELKSISYNMYIILYIAYVFIHIYI